MEYFYLNMEFFHFLLSQRIFYAIMNHIENKPIFFAAGEFYEIKSGKYM